MSQPPVPPPGDDRPDQPPSPQGRSGPPSPDRSPKPADQYGPPQGPGEYGPPQQYGQYGPPQQYGQPQPYGEPGYPSAYPAGAPSYGGPPPAPAATLTLGSLLGARARRRPDARFSSALAGAGAALALVGALVWSIGYFAKGFGVDFGDEGRAGVHGESRRFLGFGLFLALTLLGYAIAVLRRRGPLATAGTVLSAFGVPAALVFAFLDLGSTFGSGASPINLDAVYLISIGFWVASYLAVPGARGRAVYLAATALAVPSYIAIKVAGDSAFRVGFSAASGDGLGSGGGGDSHTGTVAAVTLTFGLAYYLLAALLDRADRGGVAIALLVPAFLVTLSGISTAADDFGQVGTGVTLVVVGLLVALYGGRYGRRFTTWIWAAAAAAGVVVIVTKLGADRYVTIAIVLIVVGAGLAVAAQVASGALHEQPDVVEEPHAAA